MYWIHFEKIFLLKLCSVVKSDFNFNFLSSSTSELNAPLLFCNLGSKDLLSVRLLSL